VGSGQRDLLSSWNAFDSAMDAPLASDRNLDRTDRFGIDAPLKSAFWRRGHDIGNTSGPAARLDGPTRVDSGFILFPADGPSCYSDLLRDRKGGRNKARVTL